MRDYYGLTKSGLVFGNVITVIAGFLLASQGGIDVGLLIFTIAGICLVMASGCVFNNYIDRDIDAKMPRTKDRALATGRISPENAFIFGTVLGVIGFIVLIVFTNYLTVAAAFIGFFFYVFMYSLWFKRRTTWGTFIGAIAGATPPVVGYFAAGDRLDAGAILLFVMLILWQMPHFFAIAIRRAEEYAAAEVAVMPVKKGTGVTKIKMTLYIILFIFVAPLLTVFGYTGEAYLWIALPLGLVWLALCVQGFWIDDPEENVRWARAMFLFSLFVMVAIFITISLARIIALSFPGR